MNDLATEALNRSLERDAWRENTAVNLARDTYGSDDIEIIDEDGPWPGVESVDGGYWIRARLWVSADDVGNPVDEQIRADRDKLGDLDPAQNALAVLILSSDTRQWLEDNDPMALAQARSALGLTREV